jgi:hypothetical protein
MSCHVASLPFFQRVVSQPSIAFLSNLIPYSLPSFLDNTTQHNTTHSINKPGGCAKIIKVHTSGDNDDDGQSSYVEGLDVKYVVGGGRENNLDPAIVTPYEILERGRRSRRGRDFLMLREEDATAKDPNNTDTNKNHANTNKNDTNKNTAMNQNQGRRRGRDNGQKEGVEVPMPIVAPGKENKTANGKKLIEPSSRRSGATCSTPEPPKRKEKKLPKRVTPIPKMVVIHTGKEFDDVSPMWMDASSFGSVLSTTTNNQTKNQNHPSNATLKTKKISVARGLNFGATANSAKSSSEKAASKEGVVPAVPTTLLRPKRSSTSSHNKTLQQQLSGSSKLDKHDTTGLKEEEEAIPSKRKQPPVKVSRKRKQGTDHAAAAMPTSMATLPSQRYHHSKTKPLTQQASFSRATSAYQNTSTNTNNGSKATTTTTKQPQQQQQHRKPLLDVYRCEVEKARQFMDEMVSGPRNSNLKSFTTTSHQQQQQHQPSNTAGQRVRAERSTCPKS